MKALFFMASIIASCIICSCNNASQSTDSTDSTNIRAVPDNTQNNDTATIGDTSSYERMHQQLDSPRVH